MDDLSSEDAARVLDGVPHSVAGIVGHLVFWQDWFLARCGGDALPMAAAAVDGWPRVGPSEWMAVRDRFLRGAGDGRGDRGGLGARGSSAVPGD